MKILLFILFALTFVSCQKKAFVTWSDLNGTWEKQFSLFKNDIIEISHDTVLKWHNYRGGFKDKTFQIKYDSDKSKLTLYEDGCRIEQLTIMKDRKGKLLFTVYETNVLLSEDGSTSQTTSTYRKK